jgi:hypothetical protein
MYDAIGISVSPTNSLFKCKASTGAEEVKAIGILLFRPRTGFAFGQRVCGEKGISYAIADG